MSIVLVVLHVVTCDFYKRVVFSSFVVFEKVSLKTLPESQSWLGVIWKVCLSQTNKRSFSLTIFGLTFPPPPPLLL